MADESKKNDITIIDENSLRSKIYTIRGQQVILDFDLAGIYGYSVSAFNQQVKRNEERFPEDFMFKVSPEDLPESLKSQNVILNESGNRRGMHIKKMPNAFTEQGIYMLMTVLKGELAIEQSKTLIRLFKSMKDYLIENQPLISAKNYNTLLEKVEDHSKDIRNIKENMVTRADLSGIMELFNNGTETGEILILDGQTFKADLAYQRIIKQANKSIMIVDDYIGTKTLQHLAKAKKDVAITIVSDNKKKTLRTAEYNDFLSEYPKINITLLKSSNRVHDRYIILDYDTKDMKVYHSGASVKDAGRKITTITRIADIEEYKSTVKSLLNNPPLTLK